MNSRLASRDLALVLLIVTLLGFSFVPIKIGLRQVPPFALAALGSFAGARCGTRARRTRRQRLRRQQAWTIRQLKYCRVSANDALSMGLIAAATRLLPRKGAC
jgi:hypothetical protein